MRTLKNITEGMFDIDDNISQIDKDDSFEGFFQKQRIKCTSTIDDNKLILDFSEQPGYVHVDFKVFDKMDLSRSGIDQLIIKGKSENTPFILKCDHSSGDIDGRNGFVKDVYIDGRVEYLYGSLGAKLKNTTLHSRFFGDADDNIIEGRRDQFEGCTFKCQTIWLNFDGSSKCLFDVDCEFLNIVHNAEGMEWPEFKDMTLVMADNKSVKQDAADMWGLRTDMAPKKKFWINFNGRTGEQVYKEFIKNHFTKVKFDKLKIDYYKRGYGTRWHVYINCNGRTWSSSYYGK